MDSGQVADFGFANFGICCDGAYGGVEVGFLQLVQFLDGTLERRSNKNPHQPNEYSPTASS